MVYIFCNYIILNNLITFFITPGPQDRLRVLPLGGREAPGGPAALTRFLCWNSCSLLAFCSYWFILNRGYSFSIFSGCSPER